jgi:hypothetical protein
VGGNVFSGSSGSEAESGVEVDDWGFRRDDGAAGGKAAAMEQNGHDGSAPARRVGEDILLGIVISASKQRSMVE